MTESAYTVKIFVIDGDPQGLRTIENDEWKGKALVFSRVDYEKAKNTRDEFKGQGIYILQGYEEDDAGQEFPIIYIGKTTDSFISRLNQHYKNKFEWEEGILLSAPAEILHQGKVSWLEHKFITLAKEANRSNITNEQIARKPDLSESDENEVQRFLNQALKVLPIGGFQVFVKEERITPLKEEGTKKSTQNTIVVAASMAREQTFHDAMAQNAWWAIRVSKEKMEHLTHIAFYQTRPLSAITHIAEINSFEPYGDSGKYKVTFKRKAEKLEKPIVLGNDPTLAPQSPRYSSLERIKSARTLGDIF